MRRTSCPRSTARRTFMAAVDWRIAPVGGRRPGRRFRTGEQDRAVIDSRPAADEVRAVRDRGSGCRVMAGPRTELAPRLRFVAGEERRRVRARRPLGIGRSPQLALGVPANTGVLRDAGPFFSRPSRISTPSPIPRIPGGVRSGPGYHSRRRRGGRAPRPRGCCRCRHSRADASLIAPFPGHRGTE